jgi:hypothetical protein
MDFKADRALELQHYAQERRSSRVAWFFKSEVGDFLHEFSKSTATLLLIVYQNSPLLLLQLNILILHCFFSV